MELNNDIYFYLISLVRDGTTFKTYRLVSTGWLNMTVTTFPDGYVRFASNLLTVLKMYGTPMTFSVARFRPHINLRVLKKLHKERFNVESFTTPRIPLIAGCWTIGLCGTVTKECFKYTYSGSIKTYLKPGEITKTNVSKYIQAIPMDTGDNVDMSVLDDVSFWPMPKHMSNTKYALYAMSKMHNMIFVPHPITDTYIMQMPSHVEDRMVRSIRGFDRAVHHKMRPEIIAATREKPPIPAYYDQWLDLIHRKNYDYADVVDIINNHATSDVCAYIVKHVVIDMWTLPLDADLGPCTLTDLIAKIEPEDARTYDLTWLLKSTYGVVDSSLDYRVFYRADMDWYWFKRLMDAHGNTKEVIEYAVVPYVARDHIFN